MKQKKRLVAAAFLLIITIGIGIVIFFSQKGIDVPVPYAFSFALTESEAVSPEDAQTGSDAADLLRDARWVIFPPKETKPVLSLMFNETTYPVVQDNNGDYYAQAEENFYKMPQERVISFLSSQAVSILYSSAFPPTLTARTSGTERIIAPTALDWSIKNAPVTPYLPQPEEPDEDSLAFSAGEDWTFAFSEQPDRTEVILTNEGKTVFSGSLDTFTSFLPETDFVGTLSITAFYDEQNHNGFGSATFSCPITFSVSPSITINKTEATLGEVLYLTATGTDGAEITVRSNLRQTPVFLEGEGTRIALAPISYYTIPGDHFYIAVECGDLSEQFDITVTNRAFEIQRITVDEEITLSTIGSNAAAVEYNNAIDPVRYVMDDQIYWEGAFIQPVEGEITTQFGMMRYVSNSSTPSRHEGIDIAAKLGTPVLAANTGRVLYAGLLQMTGNTILIEHGCGLKTWYYHMDSLCVSTGDMVEKGQEIGKVGSTGFSTGPHLHFNFSVNNTYLDPFLLFNNTIG